MDMPEWLSGMTRNHVGFARVGSNPAVQACFILMFAFVMLRDCDEALCIFFVFVTSRRHFMRGIFGIARHQNGSTVSLHDLCIFERCVAPRVKAHSKK